ncbi:unnamed protein product [Leuciscus chuanchicus]
MNNSEEQERREMWQASSAGKERKRDLRETQMETDLPISPCVRALTDTPYRPNGGLAEEDGSSQTARGICRRQTQLHTPPSEEAREIEINISALTAPRKQSNRQAHTFPVSFAHTQTLTAVLVKSVASKNNM